MPVLHTIWSTKIGITFSENMRDRDECTQRTFYEVENMIAVVIGYDSRRKCLVV